MAISSEVWLGERENISRNRGANAEINPQAAKETANERVPSTMCRAFEGAPEDLGSLIAALTYSAGRETEDTTSGQGRPRPLG